MADKGYDSHAIRSAVWAMGSRPAIPTRSGHAPVRCPAWVYNSRNMVERMWGRLKEWRAVATRYEKRADSYRSVVLLASTFDWLK